jgi:phenylalanyl-tRNA synthetase beta chain
MRPTLLAGVLDAIGRNARQAEPQMVFELSNIYLPTEKRQLPEERSSLTVGVVGPDDSVFMTAKGMVETVLSRVGVRDVTFQPTESKCPVWNTRASLDVYSGQDFLGVVGMALPSVTSTFSIDQVVAMVDLNFSAVAERASDVTVFESLPVFPGIERDLALVLDVKHEWESVVRALRGQNPLLVSMRFLSTYRNEALGVGNKSLAFRLTFRADDRTLKSEEVDNIVEKLVHLLQEKFGASLR